MQQCSERYRSGMITLRVNAATRLEDALEEAKNYAWFVHNASHSVALYMLIYGYDVKISRNFCFASCKSNFLTCELKPKFQKYFWKCVFSF